MTRTDSAPLRGGWAVLHQVTAAGGAPVDSQRTDRGGRYVLRPQVADTSASYLVSVEHDGIAYFTEPFSAAGPSADAAETLFVYDTSATGPPIELAERHLVVRGADQDGSRRVIELLVLGNRGVLTRIAPDTGQPVWQGALPAEAMQFEVGASDVSDQAIYRRGNAVAVAAPVPPGERQLLVSYLIPGPVRLLRIPLGQAVGRLNLLVEDTAATVAGGTLEPRGRQQLEGRAFRVFGADSVAAGTPLSIQFSSEPLSIVAFSWVLVLLAASALVAGFAWWWARTRRGFMADDPQTLAAQIAALDATFAARETEGYRRRRAELKERLATALAQRNQTE